MKNDRTFRRAEIVCERTIEFRDMEKKKPAPGEVLIRIKSSAICGSDIHIYKGKHPYTVFPCTFGHEVSGIVEDLGQGVETIKVGDRVCVEPLITCNNCYYCKRGQYAYCDNLKLKYRSGYGGFGDYYYAEEQWVHQLPESISFDEGALIEPLACAVHAVGRAGVRLGDSVCIIGDGPMGLMILQVASVAGAREIYMVGPEERKLTIASTFGGIIIPTWEKDPVKEIRDRTNGRGVDISFEAVGLNDTFDQALSVVKKGGISVIVGIFEEQIKSYQIMDAMVKEISIVGTASYCWDFGKAIDLVYRKKVDLKPLITHRFPLNRIGEAMETKVNSSDQPIKIIINP